MNDILLLVVIVGILYFAAIQVGFVFARASHQKFQATGRKLAVQVHHLWYCVGILFFAVAYAGLIPPGPSITMSFASAMGLTRGIKNFLKTIGVKA